MATCAKCGKGGASEKDQRCGGCRLAPFGRARRQYEWTAELRAELRAAYQLRKMPRAKAIAKIAKRTGWPHKVFTAEAVRMGITTWTHKVWTAEEDAQLREWVGSVGWTTIAKRLKRSVGSVQARSDFLRMSRRPCEGYTLLMAQKIFGVDYVIIRRWVDRGLFGNLRNDRISDQNLVRFLRKYPHEYDLRRVDQVLYKAALFGGREEVA